MNSIRIAEFPKRTGLALIGFYRHCISGFKPSCCRFHPTCSAYAQQAVRRFGLVRGTWLALRRLLRCHPFYRGPLYDPVPPASAAASPDRDTADEV